VQQQPRDGELRPNGSQVRWFLSCLTPGEQKASLESVQRNRFPLDGICRMDSSNWKRVRWPS
jgi:hypothetical protein